jgi:hypothetical protein
MTKITFFEFHLDGAEFTANAPGSGQEEADEAGVETAVDSDESGAGPLLALVGLVLLVGLVVAAKKLLGGDSELSPEAVEA